MSFRLLAVAPAVVSVFASGFITVHADSEKSTGSHTTPVTKLSLPLKRKAISDTIEECRLLATRVREHKQIPGLVIGISVGGKQVWVEGVGYANIEQGSKCNERTVMRVASISKSITMLLLGKLYEDGKVDLDKPISNYFNEDEFPHKKWDGQKVDITLRQLVSHLGGIRHYKNPVSAQTNAQNITKPNPNASEFDAYEYYSRTNYANVIDSLKMFKDDDLVAKPGTKFLYTTFGFTLISAVLEKCLPDKEQFGNYLVDKILRKQLGMYSTYLDYNEPIIYERSNYYLHSEKKPGVLLNAPAVDNSYKWAGGGLLSSIPDLLRFGNVMMYSYLGGDTKRNIPGFLKQETVNMLWKPVPEAKIGAGQKSHAWTSYGMGFGVIPKESKAIVAGGITPQLEDSIVAYHSGGAVGASSFMMVVPEREIVVAAFANLQNVGLAELCFDVAEKFSNSELYS